MSAFFKPINRVDYTAQLKQDSEKHDLRCSLDPNEATKRAGYPATMERERNDSGFVIN